MKPVSRELDQVITRGDFPPQQFCDSMGFLQKKKYHKEVPTAFQKKRYIWITGKVSKSLVALPQYKFLCISSDIRVNKQDIRYLNENTLWRYYVLRFCISSCHHASPYLLIGEYCAFSLAGAMAREGVPPGVCSQQGQQERAKHSLRGKTQDPQGCSSQAQTFPSIDLAVAKLSSSELQHESGLRLEIAEPRCGGRLQPASLHHLEQHQYCKSSAALRNIYF